MNNKVDIDQLFNRDFDNYNKDTSPQLDIAMEKKIKRKQRIFYFKWSIGIIIIIALLISTIVFINKEEIKSQTQENSIGMSNTQGAEMIQVPKSSDPTLHEKDKTSEINKHKPEIKDEDLKKISSHDISRDLISTKNKISLDNDELNPSEGNYNTSRVSKLDKILTNLDAISIEYQAEREELVKKNGLGLVSKSFKSKKVIKKKKRKPKANFSNKSETKKAKKKRIKKTKEEVKFQKPELKKQKISNLKKQGHISSVMVPKAKKPKKEKTPSDFSGNIGFGFAPIYFINMQANLEPDNDTVTTFNVNKNPIISYDFGLEFLFKPVDSEWSLKTGLHYQELKEEINYYFLREYLDEELSYWQYDSIFEYNNTPSSIDTILIGIDSTFNEHWIRKENQQKHINKFTFLNIPILIGYQIGFNDPRLKLNVLAGVNMSILLQNSGYYYNNDGHIFPYNKKQDAVIHWSLSAQMSVNYNWKKISVYAKPSLLFQTKEKEFVEYDEKRQYVIYGLELGVSLKLF